MNLKDSQNFSTLRTPIFNKIALIVLAFMLNACVQMHHVQIGDIDNTETGKNGQNFEVNISQVGFDAEGTVGMMAAISSNDNTSSELEDLQTLISLFQMGPKTGITVYKDGYADTLRQQMLAKCPSGNVKNIKATRESTTVATVSGEYIIVKARCIN